MFGEDFAESVHRHDPLISARLVTEHPSRLLPDAPAEALKKLLG